MAAGGGGGNATFIRSSVRARRSWLEIAIFDLPSIAAQRDNPICPCRCGKHSEIWSLTQNEPIVSVVPITSGPKNPHQRKDPSTKNEVCRILVFMWIFRPLITITHCTCSVVQSRGQHKKLSPGRGSSRASARLSFDCLLRCKTRGVCRVWSFRVLGFRVSDLSARSPVAKKGFGFIGFRTHAEHRTASGMAWKQPDMEVWNFVLAV